MAGSQRDVLTGDAFAAAPLGVFLLGLLLLISP